jgi:predicted RNase H-like HicB family nuclease
VAHALGLDVSSCGGSKEKVLKNLKEAARLFLEGAEKM